MAKTMVVATALACASCGTDFRATPPVAAPNGDAGSAGSAGSGSAGAPDGLPCDVQAILIDRCTSCHGNPPGDGAPMPLVTYDDLLAPGMGGVPIAQRALVRMTTAAMPMPPAPAEPVAASEIATFQAWVDASLPPGTCAADDPLDAGPTCTSGRYWTGGNEGSQSMHPGDACIACHAANAGAPVFAIAGTVFPTGHEPDDCDGDSGSATVVITDANGATYALTANAVGNFYTTSPVAFPIRANVLANGEAREMANPQTSGDCNACHTPTGANMAPGRITLP